MRYTLISSYILDTVSYRKICFLNSIIFDRAMSVKILAGMSKTRTSFTGKLDFNAYMKSWSETEIYHLIVKKYKKAFPIAGTPEKAKVHCLFCLLICCPS